MTKELGTFQFALVVILLTISHTMIMSKLHRMEASYTETITAYTPEDIIYLEGKHVFSESGRYDIQCSTRSHALDVFEELTVSHVNNQQ